jgi:hypothetical protein
MLILVRENSFITPPGIPVVNIERVERKARAKMDNSGIRIVAVVGSVRPGNYTAKALSLVVDELQKLEKVEVDVFDPAQMKLPLPGSRTDDPEVERLQKSMREATGVILSTPEYHGSYSSVIKLVIENLGFPSGLSGKPVALLGVDRCYQGLGASEKRLLARWSHRPARTGLGCRRSTGLRRAGKVSRREDRKED